MVREPLVHLLLIGRLDEGDEVGVRRCRIACLGFPVKVRHDGNEQLAASLAEEFRAICLWEECAADFVDIGFAFDFGEEIPVFGCVRRREVDQVLVLVVVFEALLIFAFVVEDNERIVSSSLHLVGEELDRLSLPGARLPEDENRPVLAEWDKP